MLRVECHSAAYRKQVHVLRRRGGFVEQSHKAWTRIAFQGGLLVALVIVLPRLVMWVLRSGDLNRPAQIATIIALFAALAGNLIMAMQLRIAILQLRQSQLPPVGDPAWSDQAIAMLATAVRAQLRDRIGRWGLRRPRPLRLTWSSMSRTAREVAAPADTIINGVVTDCTVALPLDDHLHRVAERFLAPPHRRLIVLGEPGAGKTVLATLLTQALLDHHQPGDAVPVLLSPASWDPDSEHLDAWLSRQIREQYLRGPAYRQVAEHLASSELVLPILDGLDEIARQRWVSALRALEHARPNEPLVITCRSQEYKEAVKDWGSALASADVIELERVTSVEALAFLRGAATPASSASWDEVAAHLNAVPDGALATALSTPLMVTLARTIYTTPGHHPSELIRLARAGGQAAVEQHLLAEFILVAYTNPPPAPGTPALRLRHPPRPEQAQEWLRLLAVHLHQHDTHDLAWWELPSLVPRPAMRLMSVIASVLAGGLVFGLGFSLDGGRVGALIGLLVGGVVGGFGNIVGAPGEAVPIGLDTSIRGRLSDLLSGSAWIGLASWPVVGLLVGLVLQFAVNLAVALLLGLAGGLIFAGLVFWLGLQRSRGDSAITPQAVLRSDRAAAIAFAFVFGLLLGLLLGLMIWLAISRAGGVVLGLMFGLVFGLAGGLVNSSWGQFVIMRGWLVLSGRLRVRLMRFLDDAQVRGLLRQAGAVYQFRHARLQDYLAQADSGR
jgi:NACHT domain